MAGTFSQIYIQIVFAVKGRENLIQKEWKDELNQYIAGIIKNKGHKPIIVNGMHDHVHVFIGIKPISDLVRDIKNNSSNFVNKKFEKRSFPGKKDMERFHMAIHRLSRFIIIF